MLRSTWIFMRLINEMFLSKKKKYNEMLITIIVNRLNNTIYF